jgi:signal transduction histidine kinase
MGLHPDTFTTRYQPDFDPAARLTWAAEPVLAQLAQDVEGSGMGVLAADARGCVVARREDEPSVVRVLDRIDLAPGFAYGEDLIGTNGIGTAIASATPSMVFGAEHFAEALTGWACAGCPVTGPDGGIVGVVDLAADVSHGTPLMLGLAKRAARDIERRLGADCSAAERALREEFAAARRQTRDPLVLVSPTTALANPAAARMLRPADRERLWDLIAPALAGGVPADRLLHLVDGSSLAIRWRRIGERDRVVGALVWLRPASPAEAMPASGLSSLTAAERTVAELAAEGLPNRAIAQRTAMSPSAVRSCLRRVYDKLGVRSRVQLARTFERTAAKARMFAALHEVSCRIERDLQDGVQQRLAGLGLSLGLARIAVPPDRAELADELAKIGHGLVETTERLREVYQRVYPALVAGKGLRPAIQAVVRRSPVPVELDLDINGRLPHAVEISVYYIVCEALAYAAERTTAGAVGLSVTSRDGFLDVTVRGDGIGEADGPVLTGLMDRVEAMGGAMRLASPPDAGPFLQIRVPAEDG